MDLTYRFPGETPEEYIACKRKKVPHLDALYALNQTASILLRLPAELRIKIWEYTLGGNRILSTAYFKGYDRKFPTWGKAYLRAEPAENMRFFLSLLRVCQQTYHEARLLPFSCNVFEFGSLTSLFDAMNEEQRNAIEWLSVELGREASDRPILAQGFPSALKPFTGLKVVVRKSPLHPADWMTIGRLAEERNCRIVEEEILPLERLYWTTLPTTYPQQSESNI